jgi:hypothetical protein
MQRNYPTYSILKRVLSGGAAMALLCASGFGVCRAEQTQAAPQQGAPPAAPPTSTLQVSAKMGRYTLDANNASVLSVLKALFDQAERQFVPDNSVTGTVTLRLTGQPFRTVLDAICAQTFLHYRLAQNGVFYIQRDDEAVKNAFTRIRGLNVQMLNQLHTMGIDVPVYNLGLNNSNVPGGGGFGGGYINNGVNGQTPSEYYLRSGVVAPSGAAGAPQSAQGGRDRQSEPSAVRKVGAGKDFTITKNQADSAKNLAESGDKSKGERGRSEAMAKQEALPAVQAGALYFDNREAYQQFLTQNSFVGFNTQGQDIPVTDVLQQLGQQANVPILIDRSVPRGMQFRIRGSVSPRPLPEALSTLAPYARLEWRYIGNTIFVTAAPDFQIFYGASETPRSSFRNATLQQKRAAPAGPAGPQGDSSKNTDAEKKNPPQKESDKDKGN